MALRIYNTLTRRKEEFVPLKPPEVRMFVCGVTVYDRVHVGHGRSYVAFDMVAKWLRHRGFKVKYIQNVTDVDDKVIKRALEKGVDALKLAHEFEALYLGDIRKLGVDSVDQYIRATEHIPQIISQIQRMMERGIAYQTSDGIYFDLTKFAEYGKLSHQPLEELSKVRIEPNPEKRNHGDFNLWKNAKPGEPKWDSPWGEGRPGWHIEDTAITEHYLGAQYDIHGGGQDLIFPHHEAEIAQMESLSGKPLVRYWMHNGFVTINGEKMSKSTGNFVTLDEAMSQHSPEVLRYMFLTAQYRDPFDYTLSRVESARNTLQRLRDCVANLEEALHHSEEGPAGEAAAKLDSFERSFGDAMDDDFNTPEALKALHALRDYANSYLASKERTKAGVELILERMRKLAGVLGLLKEAEARLPPGVTAEWIEGKISDREEARGRKAFKTADDIRAELKAKGIVLEDSAEGTRWKAVL